VFGHWVPLNEGVFVTTGMVVAFPKSAATCDGDTRRDPDDLVGVLIAGPEGSLIVPFTNPSSSVSGSPSVTVNDTVVTVFVPTTAVPKVTLLLISLYDFPESVYFLYFQFEVSYTSV
jgi:hypothetical protein